MTAGARYEYMDQTVETPGEATEDILKKGDILPALTTTLQLTENYQIRGAYSRTLARPLSRKCL